MEAQGQSQFASMTWFMGVVEDTNDPLKINRIRVRCIGYHSKDKTLLPTEDLPWAPFLSSTAQMSAPLINPGDWVVGFFIDGEMAQQPVVIGSMVGIPEEQANPNEGFYDPTGIHPRFVGEGTNSRHAREEEGTPDKNAVAYSKSTATPGVATAAGTKFSEPLSQFDARYPFNHVMETDGGHVFELDDTPGAERVQIFHRKGSFVEFHPDGSIVHRGVKDRYQIIFNNENVYAGGDMNLSVVGNVNILSGIDTNISTKGNATWRVGGNLSLDVGGNFNLAVGGATNLDTGGATIVYSGGNVELQGSQVHFNKPTSKPLGSIKPPEEITKSEGGPTVFEVLSTNDDQEKTTDEINAIRASAGLPPVDETPPTEGNSSTPPAGGEAKDVKCGNVQLKPDYKQVKISKNFTLADMTQSGSRKLVAQGGQSEADILCNLVKLAENILEPIKAAGIKFTITSAFRVAGTVGVSKGGKVSDHDIGRAVDIQVHGMTAFQGAEKIYPLVGKIAKQFLLEYTTGGGAGWIHIAYGDGASKSALPMATFNNHSTYARNKFVDLKPAVRVA